MIGLRITTNANEVLARFTGDRKKAGAGLVNAVAEGAAMIARTAKDKYFIRGGGKGSPAAPDMLTSRTGRLRRSISWHKPIITAGNDGNIQAVEAAVGTNVDYAAVHEVGMPPGFVQIPAHKRVITQAFGRSLPDPITVDVGTYPRWMSLPKRPFLVPAMQDEAPGILLQINKAQAEAYKGAH